ncbi:hypothetical protein AB2B41_17985 [Marimonas sp. MJW-29]|uniref:Excalibur calcium-binding domain-containing protein n=1 Tax=Sulfitobacter sediminis TaxID=3234186 RepID=A0ABV3RR67_9RHOB
MIFRALAVIAAGAALAGCQPAVPDSGRGVGFGDQFTAEQRAREAALAESYVAAPAPVSAAPLGAAPAEGSAEATAAETARILAATRPGASAGLGNSAATNSGVEPVQASPSNPPPPVLNSAGISQENNFDAVSGQRSIDADAARIAANRQQYQVVQPEALPDRTDTGPNIVAFALQTSHPRGTQVYRRGGFNREAKYQRACAGYSTPDQAQIDFLSRGGPDRDRLGVDPDGDGYACTWDPSPFRRAAQQG